MQLGLYRTALAAARLSSEFKVSRLGMMMNTGMRSRPEGNSVNSRTDPTNNEGGLPQSWNTSQDDYEKQFPSLSASKSLTPKGKRRTRIDLSTPCEQKSEEVQNSTNSINDQKDADLPTSFGKNRLSKASISINDQNDTDLPTSYGKNRLPKASISINDQNDTDLPTSFGKNRLSKASMSINDQNDKDLPTSFGKNRLSKASMSINDQNDTDLPTSFGKDRLYSSKNPKLRQTYHEHGEAKRSLMSSLSTTIDEPFDICPPETRESNSLRSSVNEKNRGKWVKKVQSAEEIEQNRDIMQNSNNIEDSVEETEKVLRPGMVLFKHYIPLSEQVDIVNRCRELGRGPGGFYRPGYDDGAKLRLYMMCLGLDWNPQTKRYGERRHHDNVAPPDIPHEFTSLVCRVLDESHTLIKRDPKTINVEDILPAMSPDVCIVNFYTTNGRLGLHQDRDESRESLRNGLPVVSISLGDSAEFLYGDQRDVDKAEQVLLESGDVLIFGGESRHIFHGVKTIIPNTAPRALLESTKLRPGRLNLTFRKY